MQTSDKHLCLLFVLLALMIILPLSFAQGVRKSSPVFNQRGYAPLSLSTQSDQAPGSVLIYNFYTSKPGSYDTTIDLTNTHQSLGVAVHLFFVDGCSGSVVDKAVCLKGGQMASLRASEVDPGRTGYIVAVASDLRQGLPINFNFLRGNVSSRTAELVDCQGKRIPGDFRSSLSAESFVARFGQTGSTLPGVNQSSSTARINFDGDSYDSASRSLSADQIASPADGQNTLVIVNSLNGDLTPGGVKPLSNLSGTLTGNKGQNSKFSIQGGRPQIRTEIRSLNTKPRVASSGARSIPSGRTVWEENPFLQAACSNVIIPTGEMGEIRIDSGEGISGDLFSTPIPQLRGCGVMVDFVPGSSISFKPGGFFGIVAGTYICDPMKVLSKPRPVGLCIRTDLDNNQITTAAAVSSNPALSPSRFLFIDSAASRKDSEIRVVTPEGPSISRHLSRGSEKGSAGFTIPIFPLCGNSRR